MRVQATLSFAVKVAPDKATQVPILLNTMHVWREAARHVVDYVIRTRHRRSWRYIRAMSSSPYDNTFSTCQMSVDDHLVFNVQADEDAQGNYWVRYYITVQVSGTGTITGDPHGHDRLQVVHTPPSGGGPTAATWTLTPTAASLIGLAVLACLALWWAKRVVRVKRGRRGAGA